jgi:hypothetical protein
VVRVLLRLEGIAALALAAYGYGELGGRWLWFVVFFLAPDLTLLGYLAGPRAGAIAYNLIHTYAAAAMLLAAGWTLGVPVLQLVALVLAAHIGLDRAVGYGLKYPSAAKDTHMQRV